MRRTQTLLLSTLVSMPLCVSYAHAHAPPVPHAPVSPIIVSPALSAELPARPSPFRYAFDGFVSGALVGLSGGYLVARGGDDLFTPLAYGSGIGALMGGAVGLTFGLLDLAGDRPGAGRVAMRDTAAGAFFGLTAGVIAGSLTLLDGGDGENVALGASIGTLAGAALGLAIGVWDSSHQPVLRVGLTNARRSDGGQTYLPAIGSVF